MVALLFPFSLGVYHFFQQPLFSKLSLLDGGLNVRGGGAERERPKMMTTTMMKAAMAAGEDGGGGKGGGGGGGGSGQLDFVHVAYGYLPLCWAANLAHWSGMYVCR